jgi:peroxiredoxin
MPLAVLVLCVAVCVQGAVAQKGDHGKPGDAEESPQFPAKLVDIEGHEIDVTKLAAQNNLVVVTLKATWCPVCRRQLERIRDMLPKLEPCKVTFIVLSPGPADDLAKIKQKVGFPFPFVVDDKLAVARSLGLDRPGNQIFPCMFQVLKSRRIGWKQLGRNGAYSGDGELERYFDCRPV